MYFDIDCSDQCVFLFIPTKTNEKKKFLLRVSTKHRILDTCRQCVAVYFVRNEEKYNFSHYEVK